MDFRAQAKHLCVPRSRDVYVMLRRGPRLLLEGVQHIECFLELRDVYDAVLHRAAFLNPHPDLAGAWSDAFHRLPVLWVVAFLHEPQVVAQFVDRGRWKAQELRTGTSDPVQRFFVSGHYTPFRYPGSTGGTPAEDYSHAVAIGSRANESAREGRSSRADSNVDHRWAVRLRVAAPASSPPRSGTRCPPARTGATRRARTGGGCGRRACRRCR